MHFVSWLICWLPYSTLGQAKTSELQMKDIRMPLLGFLVFLLLNLFVFSACTTTPASGPQGVTEPDANKSTSHDPSGSVNERFPPADVERPGSNVLDPAPPDSSLSSDAKKPDEQGRGVVPLDEQDPNGKNESFPLSTQAIDSVQQQPGREDHENSNALPSKEEGGDSSSVSSTEEVPPELKGKARDAEVTRVSPVEIEPVPAVLPLPESPVVSPSLLPGQSKNDDATPLGIPQQPGREDHENSNALPSKEEESDPSSVSSTEEVPAELKGKDRDAEVTGVSPVEIEPVPAVLPLPESPVVSPSLLPGQSKDDDFRNNDATARGTPPDVPLGDVFHEKTNEDKDGGLIESGHGDLDVDKGVSVGIDDSSGSVVGTKVKPVDEPPLSSSSIDATEIKLDPRSSSHSTIDGVNLPVPPVEGRIDSGKSIELGTDGNRPSGSPVGSGRYVVFGDDSIVPNRVEQDEPVIELSAEDSPNVSVSGNLSGDPTGKRIVFGNKEDVTPKRLPKRKIQFQSSGRDPVLILRRPDSVPENGLAGSGAGKSEERQFARLKELFEKRSLNSDDSNFSASEQREFENIRKLVESKGDKGVGDGNGKARPNRYLNALEWLRSKGRE
jgi:hypothetical protein